MGLLDILMGAAGLGKSDQPPQQQGQAPQSGPLDLNSLPAPGQPPVDNGPTNLSGVTAAAPPMGGKPAGRPGGGYNNTDEVNAIQQVKQQYPQGNTGSGLGLSNLIGAKGTLRDVLGTLGDAFLIQSGHQPIHAEQRYREQIANAAAGFENDPGAAASRLAATGAPGSMDDAQKMFDTAQTQKLRQSQQESNNQYRDSNVAIRQETADSQASARQGQVEDRARQAMGGMLQAAAASGDPKKYADARTRALALGKSRIKDFDADSEVPATAEEYGAGYGMSAGQVARNQTSNASIAERASSSNQRNATTIRGQNISAGNNNKRVAATERGQDMGQQNNKDRIAAKGSGQHLTIPGLNVGGGAQPAAAAKPAGGAQQFSHTATGANGKRMGWNGKQWVTF